MKHDPGVIYLFIFTCNEYCRTLLRLACVVKDFPFVLIDKSDA